MYDLSPLLFNDQCNVINVLARYEFVKGLHMSTTDELPVMKYYIANFVV